MFFQLMDVRCKYSPANSRMFRRCTVVNTSSVTIHFLPIRSNVFYTVILCKLAISHWLIWAANYTSVICRSARTTHRHRHRSLFSSMDPGILQFQRAVASYNAWHTFNIAARTPHFVKCCPFRFFLHNKRTIAETEVIFRDTFWEAICQTINYLHVSLYSNNFN